MYQSTRTIIVFFFVLLSLSFSGKVFAQQIPIEARETLAITSIPVYPAANQDVTLEVANFSTNINTANITWTVNGVVVKKGIGEKRITLKTGGIGQSLIVDVAVTTSEGTYISGRKVIRPLEVAMFWEAETFTPPFYKGKALYSSQSMLKVVAMPTFTDSAGARINPKNLVYKWENGGTVLGDLSGYGKNIYTFKGDILLQTEEIRVEVSTKDRSIVAEGVLNLDSQNPLVLMYEDHPLYGVRYERALPQSMVLATPEIRLTAVPYFFDSGDRLANLTYAWSVNGQTVADTGTKNTLSFRKKADDSGISSVSVGIKNKLKTFQYAETGISLLLPQTPSPFGTN